MNRGAWWATVHGIEKSQTRLSDEAQHSTAWGVIQPTMGSFTEGLIIQVWREVLFCPRLLKLNLGR